MIITGPKILLGDGAYFDYDFPDATRMTVDDYAWALLSKGRFSGQTRYRESRCIYTVLQHVCQMAEHMIKDGVSKSVCFAGLMHESDEIVFPDIPGPIKHTLPPEMLQRISLWGDAIDRRFNVPKLNPFQKSLVKEYDMRMLATEKRDLMPHSSEHSWKILDGVPPFDEEIVPAPHHECVLPWFTDLFQQLHRWYEAGSFGSPEGVQSHG